MHCAGEVCAGRTRFPRSAAAPAQCVPRDATGGDQRTLRGSCLEPGTSPIAPPALPVAVRFVQFGAVSVSRVPRARTPRRTLGGPVFPPIPSGTAPSSAYEPEERERPPRGLLHRHRLPPTERCPLFRFRRRARSFLPGVRGCEPAYWIGGTDSRRSPGTGPFLTLRAARFGGHRDSAASVVGSTSVPIGRVLASGARPLFPTLPAAGPSAVARRSTDIKKAPRQACLSRPCFSNSACGRAASIARPPGPAPLFPTLPSRAVGRREGVHQIPRKPRARRPEPALLPSLKALEVGRLARRPYPPASDSRLAPRQARFCLLDRTRSHPSYRLARRLPLALSARGDGRRGTSR